LLSDRQQKLQREAAPVAAFFIESKTILVLCTLILSQPGQGLSSSIRGQSTKNKVRKTISDLKLEI